LLIPAAVLLLIFVLSVLVPVLGAVLGMLSPAPLIFVNLQRGKVFGLVTVGLVFGVILLLLGVKQAVIFFSEYGVLSLIMAETVRHPLSIEKSVMFSGFGSGLLSLGFLLIMIWSTDDSIGEFFRNQVRELMGQSIDRLKEMGKDASEIEALRSFMERSVNSIAYSFPAVVLAGSLFSALANYTFVRQFRARFQPEIGERFQKFTGWMLPDSMVWALIASAVILFLPDDDLNIAALNVLIVMLTLYLFQGLAVVFHFLEAKNVPPAWWVLVLFLVLIQPLLLGAVAGFGLFDIWVDFRKIRPKNPEVPAE
jgi:uncharacterized protein YybS (DUF2232 family)